MFLLLPSLSVRLLYCVLLLDAETCAALVLYDYALTIAREVELFWKRPKRSWAFILFVVNRYTTILGHAPFLVYSFWTPKTPSEYSVNNISCCLVNYFVF